MRTFSEMFAKALEDRPDTIATQAFYSPFGFGGCAFPVFATDDQTATGLGTGFFVKGIDLGITAEHLIDVASIDIPRGGSAHNVDLSRAAHGMTALLPLHGVIFGQARIPTKHCQPVRRFLFDVVEGSDPLVALRSKRSFARRSDILFMEFPPAAPLPSNERRPRISAKTPEIGEWVCAVGYPDIKTLNVPGDELELLISELGMAVSFARVTEVAMHGRGLHETAPVVIVESDWPSGMSGGPVFNSNGRVVGVVSRELMIGRGEPNHGSFTLLESVMSRLEA